MFVKKILDKLIYYLNIVYVIIFLLLNFLQKKPYKFFKLRRDTIGNGASELYLYLNIYKNKNKHLYFYDDDYVCNDYLNLIYNKNFRITKPGHLLHKISIRIKYFKRFILPAPNWRGLYKFKPLIKNFKVPSQYKISKKFPLKNFKQKKMFYEFLKKNNLNEKTKIACLMVRDSYYKKNYSNDTKRKWSDHSYRNAKIDNYKKSVKYLLKEGYKVIKVGKGSNQKLNIKNKNYIEYSKSKYRNDFTDFYIFSSAKICITTGTGIDELASIYKVPTLDTNFFPISEIRSYQNKNVTIFKKIWSKKLNRFLYLSELIKNKIFFYPHLITKDFQIVDNTSEEIYQATKELNLKVNKKEKKIYEKNIKQKKFWYIFSTSIKLKKNYTDDLLKMFEFTYNNRSIYGSIVSNYFLNKNNWILK